MRDRDGAAGAEGEVEREQLAAGAGRGVGEGEALARDRVLEGVTGEDGAVMCGHGESVKPGEARRSMADLLEVIRERLDWAHGRGRGTPGRAAGARGLPAALEHGPAVVAAHRGRGAADPRRRGARRGVAAPRDGEAPERLGPGDVAVIRGPDPYSVADDPATEPQVGDPARPALRDARRARGHGMGDLGVRTWGNSPDGATVMLTGTYQLEGEVSGRLLRALPPALVMPGRRLGLAPDPAARLRDRGGRAGPGGRPRPAARPAADRRPARVVRPPRGRGPGWYRAYADPVVGPALRLLHNAPEHPWTVAELAAARAPRGRRWPGASASSWASRR